MPWVRGGDTAHSHRKLLRAQARDEIRGLAVYGFVHACASWSSQELLDGFVSDAAARRIGGPSYLGLVKEAQACGMMERGRARRDDGDRGWRVCNDDPDFLHIRLKEEVDRDRDKSRATRQLGPQREVRLRDGDQCRYCGITVSWTDRRSARGGTYDHPDPADRDVFVVCCFGCNRSKAGRTPDVWAADGGHQLLPAPDRPLIGATTATQFGVTESLPASAHPAPVADDAATARPGTQPDPAAPAAAAPAGAPGPDLDLPGGRVAVLPPSGRDGSQVGTGAVAGRSRDGPRRRGSRGRRSSSPSPSS